MSSISEPPTGSPISRLLYDLLQEIFTHCFPPYPLHYRQPNTRIAPILLCHISSSWRTVALTSPSLWAHLSYCLTIKEEYKSNLDNPSRPVEFVECEIEFIRWWRGNQGPIAPFLNFSVNESEDDEKTEKLTENGMAFLFEYITTAEYLELDTFYWGQIDKMLRAGNPVVYPNLHTLRMCHVWAKSYSFYQALPNHALPALRCLSIIEKTPLDNFDIPNHLSALTHVSLEASIPLDFWFSFICVVPNLQWGYFNISSLSSTDYTTPPECTLLQLTTLFIAVRGGITHRLVFPLNLLFTNLHLPALHTLSLSSPNTKSWADHRGITELYDVLQSTPAVTKLVLKGNFLSLHFHNTAGVFRSAPIRHKVQPVWNHATELVHLQLELPAGTPQREGEIEDVMCLVHNLFFSDGGWLALKNPACPR